MPIRYSALIKNDIVSIFSHYKETPQNPLLKENLGRYKFEIDKKGIYILSDKGRYLAYSFLLNENIERDKALNALFYNNAKLLEKKKYSIDSKEYEIYHFYESGNHDSVDSYYMVGVGFICFHEFQEDTFIYLNNKEALQVSEIFLKDSTFFSKSK
ncbi:MAG: hypothetical protein REI96_22455 [Flavobacterium nitrogenifigens]|uniref:hypothetical protein n=1 Tax=Flavobacterium nitrogenifigens TaxID=1617283 RepID=UPI002808424F|nr:hypothetical protein [Flavobacterium nitrogenifigens]MDQ8015225.1 hypothetical protein [Flavobacterium nitrogenifigens]